jgi:hypothetical protein
MRGRAVKAVCGIDETASVPKAPGAELRQACT